MTGHLVVSLGVNGRQYRPNLLPTGSEEKGVLGVGSIPVAILPSYQYIKLLHA